MDIDDGLGLFPRPELRKGDLIRIGHLDGRVTYHIVTDAYTADEWSPEFGTVTASLMPDPDNEPPPG